eukprot:jgi/Chrzof1/12316/Cz06g30030.t1
MGHVLSAVRKLVAANPVRRFLRTPASVLVGTQAVTPTGNHVPQVIHQQLRHHHLKPGRLIIIGDIHGCHDEMRMLLEECSYDNKKDNLLLVGDLVNKGPKSEQVVQAARECSSWVSRGNHDDAALAAYRKSLQGQDVAPKYAWVSALTADDVEFLEDLSFSLQLPDYGITIVHAGLVPQVPVAQQSLTNIYKMRDLKRNEDGSWLVLKKHAEDSVPWGQCWPGPHHVFYGHDAKRRLQQHQYATGLDTGCVYGGSLTAAIVPPLTELQSADGFNFKLKHGLPLTTEDLRVQLVSVPAQAVYELKKAKVLKQDT